MRVRLGEGPEADVASYQEARDRAIEAGATLDEVINWTWARGFATPEAGRAFAGWLEQNGFETRGYLPADPDSGNTRMHVDAVRFRVRKEGKRVRTLGGR